MSTMEILEALSYVITILGLPTAIVVFVMEQRKERQNEENELHRMLSEEYDNFLKLALDHADLRLIHGPSGAGPLSGEEEERQLILFNILISLFEKAYIIVYSERMTRDTKRMWSSWEDDMSEWCARKDFRAALPALLEGEDTAFADHMRGIAERSLV